MTRHVASENSSSSLSRRQVMVGAAGLTFALAVGRSGVAEAAVLAAEGAGKALSPWVSIAPDGTITIMSAATEMGQGSMTSLPLIIAEELDADWQKVRIVPAPPIDAVYGNPGFGGMMYTAGSNAVTSYFRPLRTFGAQVRRVLLDNAARQWGVPVEELTTEPSVVVHAKSGRRLTYGEIAAFAEIPAKPPADQAGGPEEAESIPADRQGRDARRAAQQGERQRDLRDRRPGARDAVRGRAAGAGGRIRPRQDRRCQGEGGGGSRRRRPAAARRGRARRDAVGGLRGARGAHPLRHLDPDRDGLGLRQRQRDRGVCGRCEESGAAGDRLEPPGGCARRVPEGRQHHGGGVPLRLRLPRADGAAERGGLGLAGGRCGRDLGRHPEPDHRHRGAGQVPRHFARQGEAARPPDGRRLRPARQPRRRLHHGCRACCRRRAGAPSR